MTFWSCARPPLWSTCKEEIEVVEVTERAVTYVKLKYDNFIDLFCSRLSDNIDHFFLLCSFTKPRRFPSV